MKRFFQVLLAPAMLPVTGLLVLIAIGIGFWFGTRSWFNTEVKSEHRVVINEIQKLGRLELVKYQMKDVYTKEIKYAIPGFGTKLLMIIAGEAVGCIDLMKLDSTAFLVQGKKVILKLPAPEICNFKIDHQKSKVYNADFSIMEYSSTGRVELIQAAFREAEVQIQQSAKQEGILLQTQRNAETFFQQFFKGLGFTEIVIQQPPIVETK